LYPTPARKFTVTKIAVVFHSGYGHTLRMAQAVAEGAGAELVAIDGEGNLLAP
jgi:NAD(P)H dehydrogenase (quinone)